ncbi:unnamed protein product [Brassica rapa]|uniref:Uncharacterized protein n=1 Tax=Brassica campestris TaxID=3711 RepID=A0A8D9D7R2_BRACM|nr:unnamed protein product [Brassica rapa]
MTFVAVHQYTYQHVGHWTQHANPSHGLFGTFVLGLSTLTLPVDCSGDFGPRGMSGQYTQDVRGCPPAHTGRLWLSVCVRLTFVCVRQLTEDVRGCPCVSVSTHMTSVTVHQYTYQHVGPWTQHVDPSRGLFGTHRTSVGVRQHTQDHTHDVCGFPWLSVSTHRTSVAVCVCPCVTHRTSVCVCQHTQDVRGCPSVHISAHWTSVGVHQHTQDVRGSHTGRVWVSVSTHRTSVSVRQHTQDVRVCPCVSVTLVLGLRTVALPVDCLGDFGPCGLSVQYTQDVCGCPPGHTGRPWLSVCVPVRVCLCVSVSTHRTSVAVHQYTYQHVGPWTQHADPSRGLFGTHRTSVGVRQHTQDVCGCQWLSVSTHMTFMAVRVCPCVSVGVCQHTQDIRRPWLAISTHISTFVLGLSTLALPMDCLGDFGPPHTGRPWLSISTHMTSVAACVCLCVSVSTHMTSVSVHQYTYQHVGRWTQHTGPSPRWPFPWTPRVILAHVGCLFSTKRSYVGVRQHTQDVRGCPSAHTGRPWLSVSLRVCP